MFWEKFGFFNFLCSLAHRSSTTKRSASVIGLRWVCTYLLQLTTLQELLNSLPAQSRAIQIELLEHICAYTHNSCLSLRRGRPWLVSSWEAMAVTKFTQEKETFFLPLALCCTFSESKFLKLGKWMGWNASIGWAHEPLGTWLSKSSFCCLVFCNFCSLFYVCNTC